MLLEERQEFLLDDLNSEFLSEGSNVRHESRGKQHISNNLGDALIQLDNGVTPTDGFGTKSSNKTVSHIELGSALGSFSLSSFLVVHNFLEFILEDFECGVQLSDFSLHSSFLSVSFFELDGSSFSLGLLGSDIGEYIVENSNVSNPITETTSTFRFSLNDFGSKGLIIEGRLNLCKVNGRYLLCFNLVLVIEENIKETLGVLEQTRSQFPGVGLSKSSLLVNRKSRVDCT